MESIKRLAEGGRGLGIEVVWFTTYRSHTRRGSNADIGSDGIYLVHSFKSEIMRRPNVSRQLNKRSRLDVRNSKEALKWFGTLGALVIRKKSPGSPVVLVPIPDSRCVQNESVIPRTLALAQAVAAKLKHRAAVADVLRWRERLLPSHNGGTRNATTLARKLELIGDVPFGRIVLVDDVITTGAHLFAAAAKLEERGLCCQDALCVARTEWGLSIVPDRPVFSVYRAVLLPRRLEPELHGRASKRRT